MTAVTFRDESAGGASLAEFQVTGLPASMTVRELIRLRVREEVARHNARPTNRFNGLVRPDDAEIELNGYRLREPRVLDWERQADIAEESFRRNGFFMLAGDRQIDDLDESVDLTANPDLVFIKLLPLAGG
ncbi:hypothetical protein [Actinomadura rupiterrae]|uniref:hypothetical protein n=1 Tax=Actinomadura rupiterrae TaxID=559627 RepID=UPI0020A3A824|nr:hypothetical protein [Actinomadura rupiterrae]MCP2342468.1 hypothetical protein [Actinomadura rupiterrae]